MIPASSLNIFIDPIQDPMNDSNPFTRLHVTEVRYGRNERILNTIVDIKPGQYDMYEGTAWSVTTDGDYVIGAPLNRDVYSTSSVIGILPGGGFVFGTVLNTASDYVELQNLRRSSQQQPVVIHRSDLIDTIRVTSWLVAAPWATQLFPMPDDSAEVVEKKILLATEKHRQRRIYGIFLRQAASRGWIKEWEELREDTPNLPEPRYGALVSGSVFIRDERPVEVDLTGIRMSVADASVQSSGASVSFEMPLPVLVSNTEELHALPHRDLESLLQRRIPGVRGLALMNHSRRPFLRLATAS